MTTIKGFRGLSGSIGGVTGDQDGPGLRRVVIEGQSDGSDIAAALEENASASPTGASDQGSTLSITDQLSIAAIDSVDSATTALTDIITKIQALGEKLGTVQEGTAEHTAASNEIDALENQYNNILKTDSRYVSSDLDAFRTEASSLSSSSAYLTSLSLTAAGSETTAAGSIATIEGDIAGSVGTLAVLSGQSAAYDSSISSLSVEFLILGSSIQSLESLLSSYSSNPSYSDSIAALTTELGSFQSSSSVLGDNYNGIVTLQGDVVTSITNINNVIAPSVSALSELSSASSVFRAARVGADAAQSSLSSEISAINSVSNTAVTDIASSSSSRSLSTVQSDLRSLSLDEGLRVDFSTTGLSAVTNRILENRLTDLQQAGSTAGNSRVSIEVAASASSAQAESLRPSELEPVRDSDRAEDLSKILSASILVNKDQALAAAGALDVNSVLELLKPD